ncbi:hypothetical protein Salat_0903800 [Sesamum alatum]|uniref:Reverse transcriptase zinc-binding domain-containing protein n=1 Tax=Sesamum alatum TaxID=300844 RepID=A0AAE2CR49_9LAMI|nr:hypothetical protein Salat_0903800 [Sesamum alatum]
MCLWKLQNSGSFTMRSAYDRAIVVRDRTVPSVSGMDSILGQNGEAIPTMESLGRRWKEVDPVCGICGVEPESCRHLMLDCPSARQVWALSSLPWRLCAPGQYGNCVVNELWKESIRTFGMLGEEH